MTDPQNAAPKPPRHAVFPLSTGAVRIEWPADATADDWGTIGEYLALMITKQKSLATGVQS